MAGSATAGGEAFVPGSEHHVLSLLRLGAAHSRADLARFTRLAPSTISARVDRLIAAGVLQEAGDGPSRGGRRPKVLQIRSEVGAVAAVDLGASHATVALLDMAGAVVVSENVAIDIAAGPERVLADMARRLAALAAALPEAQKVLGVAVGVPGPVHAVTGAVVSPSRMPGWNQVDVAGLMAALMGIPALADNDSNLMAVGEHAAFDPPVANLILVKAGSGIGCGVIASGRLHHGANGAAGDISHVRVTGGATVTCSCGRIGCLDALASGAALVRQLRAEGHDVADPAEVVRRAQDADPLAARLLREAGRMTGEVLATAVNFFNPEALVVGGQLSLSEPFVAALRSTVYELCLPMAVQDLTISTSAAGPLAGVQGGGRLMLDRLFEQAGGDWGGMLADRR